MCNYKVKSFVIVLTEHGKQIFCPLKTCTTKLTSRIITTFRWNTFWYKDLEQNTWRSPLLRTFNAYPINDLTETVPPEPEIEGSYNIMIQSYMNEITPSGGMVSVAAFPKYFKELFIHHIHRNKHIQWSYSHPLHGL